MPFVSPEGPKKIELPNSHHHGTATLGVLVTLFAGPVVHLQDPSRPAVGKPCAPAPTQRTASLGEETEVDHV